LEQALSRESGLGPPDEEATLGRRLRGLPDETRERIEEFYRERYGAAP